MKKLALIALIMVLGLSGCVSSGTSGLTKEDGTKFHNEPGAGACGSSWELMLQDWNEFWSRSKQ